MKTLFYNHYRLLEKAAESEYAARDISSGIDWHAPIVGILGPEGIGKTTLLLRHILETNSAEESLYVSAGDLYFGRHTLLSVAQEFFFGGGRSLYIDDLHLCSRAKEEIADIHRSLPSLKVIYAGSSLLKDDVEGTQRTLGPLSFREFVNRKERLHLFPVSFKNLLSGKGGGFPLTVLDPKSYWEEYRRVGCYPFFNLPGFEVHLMNVVRRSVTEEIPRFARMTAPRAERLRALACLLLEEAPLRPNFLKIERELGINRNDLSEYLRLLDGAGVITVDREDDGCVHKRREVVRAANPAIAQLYGHEKKNDEPWEETLFRLWTRSRPGFRRCAPGLYEIESRRFRIASASGKSTESHREADEYLVTNEIEMPIDRKIPLWAFGFLH